MDLRGVITSSAVIPSSLKTFLMYSISFSFKLPSSAPASSIRTMSSSETGSSFSCGSMPNRRSTPLADTVSSQMMGLSTTARPEIVPHTASASLSLCFIATRLGTSSPNTRVKKERISVITMTAAVLTAPICASEMANVSTIKPDSFSAKLSAANAAPKSPRG